MRPAGDKLKRMRKYGLDKLSGRALAIELCEKLDRSHKMHSELMMRLEAIQATILRTMGRLIKGLDSQ